MPKAILYVCGNQDDRDALDAVCQAGIPYTLGGPLNGKETPFLVTGTSVHRGLRKIREYLCDVAGLNIDVGG